MKTSINRFDRMCRLFSVKIVVVSVLLLAGCKTTKQTIKSNESLSTNTALNLQIESKELHSASFDWSKVDWSKISENIRIREYGAPDSTGKQPVLRDIEINRESESASDEKLHADESLESNNKEIDKSKIEADYKSAISEKTDTKTSTPSVVNYGVLALVFGLCIVVILVLKRFGLIKW